MMRIAASNSSDYDKGEADVVCTGSNDRTVLQQGFGSENEKVVLCDGLYYADRGANGVDGNPYLYPAHSVTIQGSGNSVLLAESGICRIMCKQPNVAMDNLAMRGYIHIQNYESNQTFQGLSMKNNLSFRRWLDWRGKGGCTGMLQNWVPRGKTMSGIIIRDSDFEDSYHHTLGFHVLDGQEGGTFRDTTIDNCRIISPGSGLETDKKTGDRDWSCGIDFDTGDIINAMIRGVTVKDSWQSCIHTDGSWKGHSQVVKNFTIENCWLEGAGKRAGTIPTEMYEAGCYVQSAKILNTTTIDCRVGFLCGNEESNALTISGCTDRGSLYSLVVEYGGNGAVVENFTSIGAKRRAVQVLGQNVKYANIKVQEFAGTGTPVMLGLMEKVIFIDAPSHAQDVKRYLAMTYRVNGKFDFLSDKAYSKISDFVGVHPGSTVDWEGITLGKIDGKPPVEVIPPNPLPEAYLVYEDFAFKIITPMGTEGTWFVPDGCRKYFRNKTKYVKS